MTLIVKGGSFEPAPAGPSAAVCIDVVDLGTQETPWGARSRVRLVWSLDKKMKSKKPYIVQKTYGRSLHPKSTLRQDLEAWSGKGITARQIQQGVDLERLIGRGAFLSIQHNVKDDATYANVVAIMPLPEGMAVPLPDPEYIRHKDRVDANGAGPRGRPEEPTPPGDVDAPGEDEELPF